MGFSFGRSQRLTQRPAAQGKAVDGGQSDAQRVVLALQLCAGLAACKIMSDIATKTLEGAEALTCYRQPQSIHLHTLLTGLITIFDVLLQTLALVPTAKPT